MSTEANKATVRRYFQELDKGNFAALEEVCAPTYTAHFPGAPGPMPREAAVQLFTMFYAAFPDLYHTVDDQLADGDKVAVRLTIRGTHQHEFQGIPPTGKQIAMSALNIFHMPDGRIAEHWVEYDAHGHDATVGGDAHAVSANGICR